VRQQQDRGQDGPLYLIQETSHRAGDQGEEEQHPRMLRIGELEGE